MCIASVSRVRVYNLQLLIWSGTDINMTSLKQVYIFENSFFDPDQSKWA